MMGLDISEIDLIHRMRLATGKTSTKRWSSANFSFAKGNYNNNKKVDREKYQSDMRLNPYSNYKTEKK